MPYTKYETIQEIVPQQRTEYVTQSHVEYVPEVTTEMVPVDRVQEKVQYKQVNRRIVHYPEFDRQFVEDAERSGRIIENPGPGLFSSQVVANGPVQSFGSQVVAGPTQTLTQRSGLYASQAFARPTAVQQVPLQQSFVRPNVYQSQFLQPSVVPARKQVEVPVRSGLGVSQVRPIIGSPTIRNYPYTQPVLVQGGDRQSISMKKKKGQK